MDCASAVRLADLVNDREITGPELAAFHQHLALCATCRESVQRSTAFYANLKQDLRKSSRSDVPIALRGRILRRVQNDNRSVWVVSASVALATFVLVSVGWSMKSSPLVLEDTVQRHSRSLPPEIPASRDTKGVNRFFARHLGYRVRVPRLREKNGHVQFVGARLSHINNQDAAYLMYDDRGARISLFAYPRPKNFAIPRQFRRDEAGTRPVFVGHQRGYNVVAWEEDDLVYSLVSNVDPTELVKFATMRE